MPETNSHFHQLDADIHIPTRVDLLNKVLSEEQIQEMADIIGTDELNRLAAVSHEGDSETIDYAAASKQESADLQIVRKAATEATGHTNVWVVGFASEFATALLEYTKDDSED